jgi:hypothetical protein
MQPHELIRRAAKLIEAQGWASGVDDAGTPVAARDASGNAIRLLEAGTGGDSRVKVNKRAAAFSIYGALVKAQELYKEPASVGLMWDTLYRLAREAHGAAEGGTNFVHPVIQYNETEGRTKEEVLAFMEQAAAAIEAQLNPPAPPAEATAS